MKIWTTYVNNIKLVIALQLYCLSLIIIIDREDNNKKNLEKNLIFWFVGQQIYYEAWHNILTIFFNILKMVKIIRKLHLSRIILS